MIFKLVIALFTITNINISFAEVEINKLSFSDSTILIDSTKKESHFTFNILPKVTLFNKKTSAQKDKSKLVAGLLALTLGPFGVHRLYLGTSPKVPIAYTLTLGGGFFILPLIDIFYIILSQNPEDIENNNHVFIWNKKKASE